jgi:hypothetical protein
VVLTVAALVVTRLAAAAPGDPVAATFESPPAQRQPEPTLPPLPLDGTNEVTFSGATWWGWALVDLRTGESWGSANDGETSRTASMVKAWLAALYLRDHPDPTDSMQHTLSVMIRDSDNEAADTVQRALGGATAITSGMESVCGVSGVFIPAGARWASTMISPHQTALIGACLASGKVANPTWTAWVLDEMRQVRGIGDFGIRSVFPEAERGRIAIKNGWNEQDGGVWYVNCLAIGDTWVLAVQTRSRSFDTGRRVCESVTQQLRGVPPAA